VLFKASHHALPFCERNAHHALVQHCVHRCSVTIAVFSVFHMKKSEFLNVEWQNGALQKYFLI